MRSSRSVTPQSPGSARRPPTAGSPSPTSPTATTSASSRPVTPRRSSAPGSACAAAPSSTRGGTVLAEHDGVHGFTIGQRKGLGIAGPGPDGRPRYVTAIDADSGTVHVGDAAELDVWHADRRAAGVHVRHRATRTGRVRRAGARPRRHRRRGRRTPRRDAGRRPAQPAARRGPGPDDGAVPAATPTATRSSPARPSRRPGNSPSRGPWPRCWSSRCRAPRRETRRT